LAARPGAPPPSPGSKRQSQICQRLEAQLAAIDRGGGDPARAEQLRRYEENANRQQAELDALPRKASGKAAKHGFFLFRRLSVAVAAVRRHQRQISRMRSNLDRINMDLQRPARRRHGPRRTAPLDDGGAGAEQLRPQYRNAVRAPGGFLDQLFGRQRAERAINDMVNPEAAERLVPHAVCVRTCDGFYFRSPTRLRRRLRQDEDSAQCVRPMTVQLFSYRTTARNEPLCASGFTMSLDGSFGLAVAPNSWSRNRRARARRLRYCGPQLLCASATSSSGAVRRGPMSPPAQALQVHIDAVEIAAHARDLPVDVDALLRLRLKAAEQEEAGASQPCRLPCAVRRSSSAC